MSTQTKIKQIIIGVLSLISTSLLAQESNTGIVATSSVTINDTLYLVEYEKSDVLHTITFKHDGQVKHKASTPNFKPSFLDEQVRKVYLKNLKEDATIPSDDNDRIKKDASALYIDLLYTYSNNQDAQGQKIAQVEFNTKIPVYLDVPINKVNKVDSIINGKKVTIINYTGSTNDSVTFDKAEVIRQKRNILDKNYIRFQDEFEPERCELVFEDGFISSVIVRGVLFGKTVAFSSRHPVGITTRRNVTKLIDNRLFDELSSSSYYIKLGDVITYERINDILTKDYSPKNGKVILLEEDKSQTLYKEPTSKLFHLNIFSDFVGLNQDNPNGLVQLEVDKRININTSRISCRNSGVGFFTHFTPSVVWSKIEENNRALAVSQFTDTVGNTTVYTSPLQVFRFSQVQTMFTLNVVDVYWPAIDFKVNILPGFTITKLIDSVQTTGEIDGVQEENINSPLLGFELSANFTPEKAFGFGIRSRSFYYWNLNTNTIFKSLSGSLEDLKPSDPNRFLHDLSFLVTIRLGESNDNLFFARLGIVHEWANLNNNFAQFQLGVSTYFKTSKKN